DHLRKLYEEAAREFPDVKYQQIREEEREQRREAEFWPRGAMVLVAHGVDEVDVSMIVEALRGANIEVDVSMIVASLRGANIEVEIVSLHPELRLEGRTGMAVEANRTLDLVDHVLECTGVVIPGGNDSFVSSASRVTVLLQAFHQRKRLCCGLGAGVNVLRASGASGVLYGRTYVGVPKTDEEVAPRSPKP
ncbi:hypothetical protein T484DRAFT_1831969, partial [Baffinella frigidus]